jgi:hypothetical protein
MLERKRKKLRADQARRAATAAVKKFAKENGKQLSDTDRRILDRMSSEKYDAQRGDVWAQFLAHRKSDADDQELIRHILIAADFATMATAVLKAELAKTKEAGTARNGVRAILGFLGKYPLPGTLGERLTQELLCSLPVLSAFLVEDLPTAERLGITREIGSKAETGPRVVFMARMVAVMLHLCRKPLYSPVAHLTDIVFETLRPTTEFQVRSAWRLHGIPIWGKLDVTAERAAVKQYLPKGRRSKSSRQRSNSQS